MQGRAHAVGKDRAGYTKEGTPAGESCISVSTKSREDKRDRGTFYHVPHDDQRQRFRRRPTRVA